MTKRNILPILVLLVMVLSVYLIVSSKSIILEETDIDYKESQVLNNSKLIVNKQQTEENYKEAVKTIFQETENMLEQETTDEDSLNRLEQVMFDLVVPKDYQDLHISLFMALKRLEDYSLGGDVNNRLASAVMITKIKEKYSWLKG